MTDITGFYINRDSGLFCSDESVERPSGAQTALEFLIQHQGHINMFSDLDADVAALLGMITGGAEAAPKEWLKALNEEETVRIGIYTLKYFPNRFFAVEKDLGTKVKYANFADASRYQYSLRNTENNKSQKYGMKRAEEAARVGQEVYHCLEKLGMRPTSLVSPASVFRKHFYDTGVIELPSLEKIPDGAMVVADECCKGNWVQTWQRGYWDSIYDYDINSAYPAQATKLLDLDQGKWEESAEYQIAADYGYCRCIVKIEAPFSPIIMKVERELFTPRGEWLTSLTKSEIYFIKEWGLGEVKILNGWWWFGKESHPNTPLAEAVDLYYHAKERATGIEKETIKMMMAGAFYGVFIETNKEELGEYYCSPWAAEIETGTRLEVARPLLRTKEIPIAIAVDGTITANPIMGKNSRAPNLLGSWRRSHTGKCLSIGTGLVAMETKEGEGDFALTYDRAMAMIKGNPKAEEWSMEKVGVVKLARACQEKRYGDVGKVETMTRTIDLTESKMDYDKYPKNGGDLLKKKYIGKPWGAEILRALEEGT